MKFQLTGELYDISQLRVKKKIRILLISPKNLIIDFDDKIQKQLIKRASKKDDAFKIKSCKPYTFYKKYDRLIITVTVSNQTSGLFFLEKENIGRLFHVQCNVRTYSFAEKKSGDVILGWNMMLKKINPVLHII